MSGKLAPVKSCRIIGRENEAIGANKGWQRMIFCMYWQCTRFIDGNNIDTFVERKKQWTPFNSYDHIWSSKFVCVHHFISHIHFLSVIHTFHPVYLSSAGILHELFHFILIFFLIEIVPQSAWKTDSWCIWMPADTMWVRIFFVCIYMYVAKWQSIAKKYPKVIYHDYCNKIWK